MGTADRARRILRRLAVPSLLPSVDARREERAVSPVLGSVLVAGIIVLLIATLQLQAVPMWNADFEYDHNQAVVEDLQQLQSTIHSVGVTGTSRSVVVRLGTSYPHRTVLRNYPADPMGTLATGPPGPVVVNNSTTTGEAGDFWNGSERTVSTRPLVYEPDYNYYSTAPVTVYENNVLYNRFESANVTLTGQTLVDGRRITLIALDGTLSTARAEGKSVRIRSISAVETSLALTNETGEPITVSVPTRLPNATWRDLLEDEYVGNGGHIVEQSYRTGSPYNRLILTFERGVTYELRMAAVGVGTDATEPDAAYVVFAEPPDSTVTVGTSHAVTVEVRDRYNNPVSGALVNATPPGRFEDPTIETDAAGRATFNYTAPDADGTDTLQFNISDAPTPEENASASVAIVGAGGGGVGGGSVGPETTNVTTDETTASGQDVLQGTELNLTATVSDIGRGGTDIVRAEWWSNKTNPGGSPGNGVQLAPRSGDDDEFDSPEEHVINVSIDTSSWDLGRHNLSVRGKDAAGNWGPAAHYEINITGFSGPPSASVVQVTAATKTGASSQTVLFTLENTGSRSVQIKNLSVDSVDANNVDTIANGSSGFGGYTDEGPELRSNRTGSLLDNDGFGLAATQPLDSSSTIAAGQRTRYTLAEFRVDNFLGGTETDPGATVTITIGFTDGSEKTVTLSL